MDYVVSILVLPGGEQSEGGNVFTSYLGKHLPSYYNRTNIIRTYLSVSRPEPPLSCSRPVRS